MEALPELSSVAEPRVVAPLVKVTVPLGMVEPDAWVTVAVKVTAWP